MKKESKDSNPNAGWNQADEWYLQRHDNMHEPNIQIFDEGNWEDENKERRKYFCAICKGKLDYLKNMDMWFCSACVQYYDTKIQDVPIKNLSEPKVKTFLELEKYPTYDEQDVCLPIVQGIDPDAETSIPGNVEIIRDEDRVNRIRVKGLPTEALAAMREMDGKFYKDCHVENMNTLKNKWRR